MRPTTTATTTTSTTTVRTDTGLARRTALAGFRAVCEALYPDNDLGAPSWRDTEMVERADRLWTELPPESRGLMIAMYSALELGASVLAPRIGLLSKMPVEKRLAMLKRWKSSSIWPLRFLAEAIKSSTTMVYMSHPTVTAYIGATKACGTTAAHGHIVKENAFAGLLPRAERQVGGGK